MPLCGPTHRLTMTIDPTPLQTTRTELIIPDRELSAYFQPMFTLDNDQKFVAVLLDNFVSCIQDFI